ncbi:MAG: DUF4136 domain-containing protein, partial [Verrucomicrobiae bacterium]|nr:DUF4136 domain-containing protein [Verrucomicrobiae bacterium]
NTTSSIQSVRKEEADFSKILTYSYVDSGMARTLPGVSPAELLWAEEIIGLELARRGYKPVATENADMIVTLETEVTGGREKGGFSIGLGTGSYSRSGGSSVGVSTGPIGAGYIEQSTLTIRAVDRSTDELLWVGWIDKLENNKFSQEQFKAKIREIMASFPAS